MRTSQFGRFKLEKLNHDFKNCKSLFSLFFNFLGHIFGVRIFLRIKNYFLASFLKEKRHFLRKQKSVEEIINDFEPFISGWRLYPDKNISEITGH